MQYVLDRRLTKTQIIETLVCRGNELLQRPYEPNVFTWNKEADALLNDTHDYPHAFVLACVMDRQIKAERAWLIPYHVKKEIGGFEFEQLMILSPSYLVNLFQENSLHRFNETMALLFYEAIRMIETKYDGNAANIWEDTPRSATIVRRFLEFKGVGVKIATMAANILARDFKIPMQDRICIDISPDVQVKRVFMRLGFIHAQATNDQLIFTAREFYPEYPGIFDLSAWEIGRKWCRPKKPDCAHCYLEGICPKYFNT